MKLSYLIIAGAFALASCNAEQNKSEATTQLPQQAYYTAPAPVKTLESREVKVLLQEQPEVVILDVRTPEEFFDGHLKNALHLNIYDADFDAKLKQLDRDKPYLVYCAIGGRSKDATRKMQQLGFRQVYDATEGFNALKSAGIPTE